MQVRAHGGDDLLGDLSDHRSPRFIAHGPQDEEIVVERRDGV
jgi:hypothetical protein